MRSDHWRPAAVDSVAALLTWYARSRAAKLAEEPPANDGARPTTPSTNPPPGGVPSPGEGD